MGDMVRRAKQKPFHTILDTDQPGTVAEMIGWGTHLLAEHGVDTPRLDAEVLMANAIGTTRTALYAGLWRGLSTRERVTYREHLIRRARREPLAYITGHKEFYGLDFHVDSRVLIPRPETELLVERAMYEIDAWSRRGKEPVVVDVGTGSGAIAVALTVHRPNLVIYAVDCFPGALEVARVNAARHGVAARIRFLLGDLLDPLPVNPDLILANLPYVGRDEWETLAPEITNYEPHIALDGGDGGLEVLQRLLIQATSKLRPGGVMLLEIGATQGERASRLALTHFPDASISVLKDYAGLDRLLRVVMNQPETERDGHCTN